MFKIISVINADLQSDVPDRGKFKYIVACTAVSMK
jgi:hypothetical protein